MSDLEQLAIERLKAASEMSLMAYQQPLVICVSGGKDSGVITELAVRSGIPCEFQHNHTTADAPETVRYGRWVNMGGFPACSECACSPAVYEPKPNNPKGFPEWCYGCGAKMDLEDDNGNQ